MVAKRTDGLNTAAWQATRLRVLDANTAQGICICAWCHKPIDRSLKGTHPYGPTVDHWVSRDAGAPLLDENNLFPFHNRCNSIKSNKAVSRHSRQW